MSVNIYDGTNLTPIAGKTVPAPTPDYVDEQYNNSTTYSKGMTCISGNIRYRYINSTATSGHQPPNNTYWEVLSVASEIGDLKQESISGVITKAGISHADLISAIRSVYDPTKITANSYIICSDGTNKFKYYGGGYNNASYSKTFLFNSGYYIDSICLSDQIARRVVVASNGTVTNTDNSSVTIWSTSAEWTLYY